MIMTTLQFHSVDDVILTNCRCVTNVQDPTDENAATRFRRNIHHLTAESGEVGYMPVEVRSTDLGAGNAVVSCY